MADQENKAPKKKRASRKRKDSKGNSKQDEAIKKKKEDKEHEQRVSKHSQWFKAQLEKSAKENKKKKDNG